MAASNRGSVALSLSRRNRLVGVGDEVDVERADALLEDAPHRLAEVGDDPHQGQPREPRGAHLAVVGLQQDPVLRPR